MAPSVQTPWILRFGVFEVNLRSGEVRKQGFRVRVQEQPLRVLIALLQRPGEVVTREELRSLIWSADTFVDFDNSLNTSINKLREALGDSAENPRFIETLPRRGYRFIAPVATADAPVDVEHPPMPVAPSSPQMRVRTVSTAPSSRKWVLALIAVATLAGAVAFWRRPTALPRVTGSSQITHDGLPKWEIVTDGSRLYFTEFAAGHTILSQVSTTGGETAQVSTPFTNFRVGDLSPNRSELLLVPSFHNDLGLDSSLWSVPLPTGAPRRIAEISASDASWSPDGRQILFCLGHDLYVCDGDGSHPKKLATIANYPVRPRWSPSGDVVRFSGYDLEDSAASLWEVHPDGTGPRRLLAGWNEGKQNPLQEWAQACCGNWTPDGGYYLFQSGGNIWAIRERARFLQSANRTPVQLTFGPLALSYPVVSADGKKVFVVGQLPHGEVARYDAKSRQFIPYLAGASAGQLDFSREGGWVAYVAYPEATLWRCKVDGSDKRQLTYSPLRAALPRWSPDGRKIAFMASEAGKPWRVSLLTVADGRLQDLLPGRDGLGDPSWSPDGNSLVFGSVGVDANSSSRATTIQMLDLRTNQVSTLPGSEGFFSPRWSPNGHFLVALTSDSQALMLYDFNAQTWSVLTQHPIGYPSWSKDSKYVFFDDTSFTDSPGFYRVRISDHTIQRVASLQDIRQVVLEWPFGSWTGVAPDDSPLVQRDVGTQEIYALDLELP